MATITEDYISFETAKLLKEKGFNAQCNYVWMLDKANNPKDTDGVYKISSSHFMEGESYISNEDIDKVLEYSDEYYNKDAFLCPTLQMAMKWLRKEHKLHIQIWILEEKGYWFDIEKILNAKYKHNSLYSTGLEDIYFETYEQAAEAAIKYCLEKLI